MAGLAARRLHPLSNEFQSLADDLARKAKDQNLDGATLSYVKLTINGVECHELVRDERPIGLGVNIPGR